MISDDERREVARRLRSFVTDDSVNATVDASDVLYALGLHYADIDRIYFCWYDVARLADLIDPPARCPHYMYPCCRTDAGGDYIDRDALLELASSISVRHSWLSATDAERGKAIARRIREALGVVA